MNEVVEKKTYYCERCKKTLRSEMFYTSNNLEKYPDDGKLHQCKQCITAHIDNWNPDTYLWILQELDIPYIPDEWAKLMNKYAREGKKLTGTTILGRYISKMKLTQYREYRWKDNDFLLEMANNKIEQTMKRQGYGAAEIASVLEKSIMEIPDRPTEPDPEDFLPTLPERPIDSPNEEDYFAQQANIPLSALGIDLTEEDRTYLLLKWGKAYKPDEWIKLEQLYEEMMESYDIQTAGHIDTLKLICKTSLKANQLIDIGDIEGFQKMSKVYDSLMKSGKFTAAQNKSEQGEFIDSVGELIEMCEKQGYIERFYIDQPNDKVDFTIQDMQRYTRTLIEEETNLSDMIEMAIKQNAREDEEAKKNLEDTIVDDMDMSLEDLEKSLTDTDFEDFEEFIDEEAEDDLSIFNQEGI